jgi:hypothetical protein
MLTIGRNTREANIIFWKDGFNVKLGLRVYNFLVLRLNKGREEDESNN